MEENDVINSKTVNTREIILDILIEVLENEQYSHIVISSALKKYQYLSKQDRAFIDRVSQGTIEKMISIDYIIGLYSTVKVKRLKPVIRNILRMAVYQIVYMESVKEFAICNEAVKLAGKRGFSSLKGFVNGILRNILRDKDNIPKPDREKDEEYYLSVLYSMPMWIITKWKKTYSYEQIEAMLKAFDKEKKTTIRCNLNVNSLAELKKKLDNENVSYSEAPYVPYGLNIDDYNYLEDMDSFLEGSFSIQDVSSMLVGMVAAPKKGAYVVDVCAAPGGKTLHIAELLDDTGYVEARDVSKNKVELIRENIERCKLNNATALVKDALIEDEADYEKADILIADLPCSGLGIMGRKGDIRYNMSEEKQEELVKLQRNILSVVNQYVKVGGHLIYSTCTINEDENINNVRWFTKKYGFVLESIDDYIPEELHSETTKEGYIQLLPGVHKCDGFFIARLRRIK